MALKITCDNHDCTKECPATETGEPSYPGWVTMITRRNGKDSKNHYCGYSCAHKHTYLLISGDNGK